VYTSYKEPTQIFGNVPCPILVNQVRRCGAWLTDTKKSRPTTYQHTKLLNKRLPLRSQFRLHLWRNTWHLQTKLHLSVKPQLPCIRLYLDSSTVCNNATSIVHSKLDYWNSLYHELTKARSTPATMSKQHCRSNWQLCCLLLRHCCQKRQQCRSIVRLCSIRQCCFDLLLVWTGFKSQLSRLQRIQNSVARAVVKDPKSYHITFILRSIHWLKITKHIKYKLLWLNCKVLTTSSFLTHHYVHP